ncbi:MAG: hypothetical protein KKA51_06315 [Nanoarchaeota archaeon]|nr:hypothetical protein [Nanoarchaeota archaeon]
MNDREQVSCDQEHEMKYILRKFGKKQTKENISAMKKTCEQFKKASKDDCRTEFYKYLDKNKVLSKLK